MEHEKRISKSGRVYYNYYVKKVWDRKTTLVLSRKGKYYYSHKKEPFTPSGLHFTRIRCFERDNYTCKICGVIKARPDAHHKDNLGTHLINNANNKEDNLVTLCHSCHLRLHYGVLAKHREIIHLRLSGYTLQEIATRFSVSRQRIHQILIKNNFSSRLVKT